MTERERTYAVQLTVDEAHALLRTVATFGLLKAAGTESDVPSGLEGARAKLLAFKRRFTPREEPPANALVRKRASRGSSGPRVAQPAPDPEPEAGEGTTHA